MLVGNTGRAEVGLAGGQFSYRVSWTYGESSRAGWPLREWALRGLRNSGSGRKHYYILSSREVSQWHVGQGRACCWGLPRVLPEKPLRPSHLPSQLWQVAGALEILDSASPRKGDQVWWWQWGWWGWYMVLDQNTCLSVYTGWREEVRRGSVQSHCHVQGEHG